MFTVYKLKEYTRKRDVHFYKLQQSLLSGITAITRIADMTTKSKTLDKSQTEQTRQLALDALSLCAITNFILNVQRKFFMKPDIGKIMLLCVLQISHRLSCYLGMTSQNP